MFFVRANRRFTTWLAMLAMLLGALAPSVAQAMVAASDRSHWVEVCSASGILWVKAGAPADASAAQPGDHGAPVTDAAMHCPWCTLHGGAAGLPPAITLAKPLPRQTALPSASLRAATLPGVWAVAHARAPPLSA